MADKIITFEYAFNYLGAFQTQPIPNTTKCMTKSDVNNYLNVDQSPINGYSNNQLVPISKVVGMANGMPDDITYRFFGDKDIDVSYIYGYREIQLINDMPNTNNHFNGMRLNSTMFRASANDPSYDENFLFDIVSNPDLQPLNEVLANVYKHFGIDNSVKTILERGDFILAGQTGVDYGNRTIFEDKYSLQSSQIFTDMRNGGAVVRPIDNLGYMKFTSTDLTNTGNIFNIQPPRSYMSVGSGQAGYTKIMFHYNYNLLSDRESETGQIMNYYNLMYAYNNIVCSFILKRLDGSVLQRFTVKFYTEQ